jgi:hypothetical protein
MSASVRAQVLQRLASIVDPENPDADKIRLRHVISAARALLAADALNLQAEQLELRKNGDGTRTLAELVEEAEAAAAEHTAAERPAEMKRP